MVKVRTYEDTVRETPRPTTTLRSSASAQTFGAGVNVEAQKVSQTLGQVADVIGSKAIEYQTKINKVAAKDAYLSLSDKLRGLKVNYTNRKRGDAKGITPEAQREIDDIIVQTGADLENDEQIELFEALSASSRATFLDNMSVHEQNEINNWNSETSAAMTTEAIDFAVENYNDPESTAMAISKIDIAVSTALEGSGAEIIESEIEKNVSNMHASVVEAMALNNAVKAKEYYAKYKNDIDGKVRTSIEGFLKSQDVSQWGIMEADRIVGSGKNITEQREEARKLTENDSDKRRDLIGRIDARYNQRKTAELDGRRDTVDNMRAMIIDAPNFEAASDIIRRDVDNGSDEAALLAEARSKFTQQDRPDNPIKKQEALEAIDNDKIKTRSDLFMVYREEMSESDWKEAEAYFDDGGAVGDISDSNIRSLYTSVSGKDPKDKKAEFARVWKYVTNNLEPGKKATEAELKDLIKNYLWEGERLGGGIGFGRDSTYYEAEKKGHAATWLPDLEGNDVAEIDRILKENSMPINNFNRRLYKRLYEMGRPYTAELKAMYDAGYTYD